MLKMEDIHSEKEPSIYDDLMSQGDLGVVIHNLQFKNKQLQLHVVSLEEDIQKLCDKITEMKNTQENLSRNISELYKTAKSEIDRKDRLIAELQSKVDDMVFRRNTAPSNFSFKRKREQPVVEVEAVKKPKSDDVKHSNTEQLSRFSDKNDMQSSKNITLDSDKQSDSDVNRKHKSSDSREQLKCMKDVKTEDRRSDSGSGDWSSRYNFHSRRSNSQSRDRGYRRDLRQNRGRDRSQDRDRRGLRLDRSRDLRGRRDYLRNDRPEKSRAAERRSYRCSLNKTRCSPVESSEPISNKDANEVREEGELSDADVENKPRINHLADRRKSVSHIDQNQFERSRTSRKSISNKGSNDIREKEVSNPDVENKSKTSLLLRRRKSMSHIDQNNLERSSICTSDINNDPTGNKVMFDVSKFVRNQEERGKKRTTEHKNKELDIKAKKEESLSLDKNIFNDNIISTSANNDNIPGKQLKSNVSKSDNNDEPIGNTVMFDVSKFVGSKEERDIKIFTEQKSKELDNKARKQECRTQIDKNNCEEKIISTSDVSADVPDEQMKSSIVSKSVQKQVQIVEKKVSESKSRENINKKLENRESISQTDKTIVEGNVICASGVRDDSPRNNVKPFDVTKSVKKKDEISKKKTPESKEKINKELDGQQNNQKNLKTSDKNEKKMQNEVTGKEKYKSNKESKPNSTEKLEEISTEKSRQKDTKSKAEKNISDNEGLNENQANNEKITIISDVVLNEAKVQHIGSAKTQYTSDKPKMEKTKLEDIKPLETKSKVEKQIRTVDHKSEQQTTEHMEELKLPSSKPVTTKPKSNADKHTRKVVHKSEGQNMEELKSEDNKSVTTKTKSKLDKNTRECGVPRNLTGELNIHVEKRPNINKKETQTKLTQNIEKKISSLFDTPIKDVSKKPPFNSNIDLTHEGNIPLLQFESKSHSIETGSKENVEIRETLNPVTEFQIFKTNLPSLERSNSFSGIQFQTSNPTSSSKSDNVKTDACNTVEKTEASDENIEIKSSSDKTKEKSFQQLINSGQAVVKNENIGYGNTNDMCNISLDLLNTHLGVYKAEDYPNLTAHSETKDMPNLLLTPVSNSKKDLESMETVQNELPRNLNEPKIVNHTNSLNEAVSSSENTLSNVKGNVTDKTSSSTIGGDGRRKRKRCVIKWAE